MSKDVQISVYYFPNYHDDERNFRWHGRGWTEWELVKNSKSRFKDHQQPKVPMWGFEDESLPEVMAKKIDVAVDNGVDNFIFDWYWYEDGPYLNKCLDNGLLKAKNSNKINFSLMWANHDWIDIHPAQRGLWTHGHNTLAYGKISINAFRLATQYMIENYFNQTNYYKLDGGLYLSIYMIAGLVESLGGLKETRKELDNFRERVRKAGLGELHLNGVVWGQQILPGEKQPHDINNLMDELGFDSITSYVWIHHISLKDFPFTDYSKYRKECVALYPKFKNEYKLPYYPNVTMGWDSSPRTIMSDQFDNIGYPFTPILVNNTPEEFEEALNETIKLLKQSDLKTPMLTINAWNEWTEGSYLEPDMINGYKYLNAIKKAKNNF